LFLLVLSLCYIIAITHIATAVLSVLISCIMAIDMHHWPLCPGVHWRDEFLQTVVVVLICSPIIILSV
jgi:hypothetical protein